MTLVQLVFANVVLLLPGALVARALGIRSVSATLAWSLALIFGALAVTFAVGSSLTLTLLLLLVPGIVALRFARNAPRAERIPGRRWVFLAGALLGLLLWHVAGNIGGDGLFHLARVQKLDAFGSLSLDAVNEFADGGLHPGYAFPLWHGFLALVARVGFLDPAEVVLHEATVLAPIALLVTYEAGLGALPARQPGRRGRPRRRRRDGAGTGPRRRLHRARRSRRRPRARSCFRPRSPSRSPTSRDRGAPRLRPSPPQGSCSRSSTRPTRSSSGSRSRASSSFASLAERREARRIATALAALVVPAAAYLVWLLPVVRDTRSHDPGGEELQRAFRQYAGQLDVFSDTSYRLAPEVFGRAGAVAVAALLFVPLAGLALRKRWAAYVLGGFLAVAAVMLVPQLFVAFSDMTSISQSRRAAGFWPLAFSFAGGFVVLGALLRGLILPAALVGGIALQLAYPGEFTYRLEEGGPAFVTWFAVGGGVAALVVGLVFLKHKAPLERPELAAWAAALFVLPVAVHAAANWSPSDARAASPLTPGLVAALRENVARGDVVYSDPQTSYEIAARVPVYIAVAPPGHVADTEKNRPYERRDEALRFFETGDAEIPRRAGADWLVVDRKQFDVAPQLDSVYRDGRYTLYAVP